MRLNLLFRNRLLLLYLPVLAAAAALVWASFFVWAPLPPSSVVIAAGNPEGGYADYARRYAARLGHADVQANLVFNDGWTGISTRFAKPDDEAHAGFVQGLYSERMASNVRSLAAVAREPVWIVTRLGAVVNVSQLKGLRVAVGSPGSSSHVVALKVLAAHGIQDTQVTLHPFQGVEAMNALLDNRVDAAIQVLAVHTQAVQMALQSPALQFVGLNRSEEIRASDRRLHVMVLPQGSVDLRSDIPTKDLAMLSTETHLVVRDSMHPALQRLMLRIALEVHEMPGLLQNGGEYPSFSRVDIPLSPFARPNSAANPWFENLLPYWWAQLAQVLFVYVLPIALTVALLLTWIPRWFDWRVSSALLHHYGELRYLDDEMSRIASEEPMALRSLLTRIDAIEQSVAALELPDAYAERWYTLRAHLAQARERLLGLRAR
jgi:NMT1-like family